MIARRGIGAVLLGIIVAVALLVVLQFAVGALHAPGPDVDLSDPAQMEAHVAAMPPRSFLLLLGCYVLSGFGGGWAAARVAPDTPAFHGLLVGIVFALAGLVNVLTIKHPAWYAAASVLAQLAGPVIGARVSGGPRRT